MSTTALRERLAELDAEIVEKKTVLKDLERDRTAVHRQLHATSTFPVLTLPVEITAEIFSLSLPSIEEIREHLSTSAWLESQAPTVFLGVCRAWKDIALETSALWATLPLRFDFISDNVASEPGAVEKIIDMWFRRAVLRPLSIVFFASEISPDSPFTPSRLRDVIHCYAHRLQHIELYICQCDIPQLGLDSVAFPLLRRAVLDDPFDPEPDPSNPVVIYNNAPQLHDLILRNGTEFSFYAPPLLQLTKFEGEIDNLNLFVLAPNLLEADCVLHLRDLPTSPIFHPRLQSLTLCTPHYSDDEPIDVFPHLKLPALQYLHISDIGSSPESLFLFLDRSSPPLSTLSATVTGSFSQWDTCFARVAATLENLEVFSTNTTFQNQVLNLGSPNSDYNPLPRLRTFHLVTSIGADYKILVDFLRIRSTTPALAKIRSFRVTCRPGAYLRDSFSNELGTVTEPVEAIGHLARLASEGIDIYIETTEKTFIKHVQYIPGDPAYEFASRA